MKRTFLYTPGPTQVPEDALLEMARPIIHHRTPQFEAIFADTLKKLKWLFQTQNDVLILASSGTGAMEGSVVNFLSKGDKAIVVNAGKFGERWGEICRAYGVEVIELKIEWGKAVKVEDVKAALDANPDVKAVYITASETSTGVAHPIKEVAALVKERENTIIVVDAITALGAFNVPTDEWGLDVVVSGSQKALMLPPGLGVVSISEKAWKLAETSTLPKFYFNFKKERKNHLKNTTAYTAAVTLVIGLNKTLSMMQEDGLETVFARTEKMAHACREAVQAIGLKLLAPTCPSPSVTSVFLPESVDGGKLVKLMRDTYGVGMAGGQDDLKGRIIRISHMGYVGEWDLYIALTAVEKALNQLGHVTPIGKAVGVAAAIMGA